LTIEPLAKLKKRSGKTYKKGHFTCFSGVLQKAQYIIIYLKNSKQCRLTFKVYDGLPARIRACEARPGLANCGWSEAWEWSAAE
jgi:hypothetical protein